MRLRKLTLVYDYVTLRLALEHPPSFVTTCNDYFRLTVLLVCSKVLIACPRDKLKPYISSSMNHKVRSEDYLLY